MSNLNLTWLANNLRPNAVIFDIGAADLNDTRRIKAGLPDATFYAFECAKSWAAQNKQTAVEHGINYYHMAMSDTVGTLTFHPSAVLDGQEWPWSGSVCEPGPNLLNERWKWGEGYTVPSTTLESFCAEHNLSPDFIHIDVQGAEFRVFSAVGSLRPGIVWAEISEFHMYKTGTTYDNFKALMESLGYVEQFKDSCDALYTLNNFNITEYEQKS
jgi:FkbM family methyltransferase